MNTNKKKILAVLSLIVIMVIAGAAVMVSYRMSSQQKVAPTAPESEPMAAEIKEADVLTDAEEKTLEAAGTLKPACGTCKTNANCQSGLTCDPADGRCKTDINTTICWSGPVSCVASAEVACTPSGVVTCSPDCPTACGTAASTISTCTNSCGVATTKACAATAACGVDGGWSEYGSCSATACGTSGTKTRTCNDPAPSNGGAECTRADDTLTTPTNRTETVACSAAECDCTPSGVITCNPGCPTACGSAASTITSCTDSCGGEATKACAATAACGTRVVPTEPTVQPTTADGEVAPTVVVASPTVLPEAGILDFPGVAAFGGGLILAIVGILLAL